MPLQKPGVRASEFRLGPPVNQSLNANRFPDSENLKSADGNRDFSVATDTTATQLPDELGLVDPAGSTILGTPALAVSTGTSSVCTIADAGKTDLQAGSSKNSSGHSTSPTFKIHSSQYKSTSAHQYGYSSGNKYQRGGGGSQKNSLGAEWSHRRMGLQARNQSGGAENSFPPSKMKQIYVAKQTMSGTGS